MQYRIYDHFMDREYDHKYTEIDDAVETAFGIITAHVAGHIDPDLEVGETDTYTFTVTRVGDDKFVITCDENDSLHAIVEPVAVVTEQTYVDLYNV